MGVSGCLRLDISCKLKCGDVKSLRKYNTIISMSSFKTFWAVTALAFGLRALALFAVGPNPVYATVSDTATYVVPAQNLLHHGAFATVENGQLIPEFHRTPGYPVFLIPFLAPDGGVHHRALQWVQAALNALSAGLIYFTASLYWKNRQAAILAGVGMALDFVNIIHCMFILADVLFVFLLSLALLCLARRQYPWAGFSAALAAYVKPLALYYPSLIGIFLLINWARGKQPRTAKTLALYVFLSFVPLFFWMHRNDNLTGHWTFTSFTDENLYLVRAPMVEMDLKNIPYEAAMKNIQQEFEATGKELSSGKWALHYLWLHRMDEAKVMMKDLGRLLSGNSVKVIAWAILKDDHYNPSGMPYIPSQSHPSQARELLTRHPILSIALVSYLVFLGVAYILAGIGFWTSWHQKGWEETLLMSSSIYYFAFLTLGVYAQARYRLPIMPAVFFLAAGGWETLHSRFHGG
jgi:4-amino-4-deoxy-L-arabinose transferase-like glycosyltransferase